MTKVAILIDGAYLLKRLPFLYPAYRPEDPEVAKAKAAADAIKQLTFKHLEHQNKTVQASKPMSLLYRVFYYDAEPYEKKEHRPITRKVIHYKETAEAKFRSELFNQLRRKPNTAVRLGKVRRERGWVLKEAPQKALLSGKITVDDLTDDHFKFVLKQKAVDMRIGIDITSMVLKRQADIIVLIAGDADFVPAAKLARREGARIILDPLWLNNVSGDLYEHIDGVYSGFPKQGTDGVGNSENIVVGNTD